MNAGFDQVILPPEVAANEVLIFPNVAEGVKIIGRMALTRVELWTENWPTPANSWFCLITNDNESVGSEETKPPGNR